ncbi:hypothetical protein SKP52_10885 [Sphingopyxis fribergensis]|uniref:Uncharacterized protein n=1 Tax=Sphingopyxis fribergensis TaxID=1515612 RepID=A0A0A7PIN2_9SPHN|nr:hypothetical protein [Sphingopyxis fribergensis]AJA09078.1 hypothetical protein SKP52_10885 [Sphingopyxis fribergensis]
MKADEPGSRVQADKYGMPIENAHHIVRRHFEVLDEEAALKGAQVAHDIKCCRALRAERELPTVSASVPAMSEPAPSKPVTPPRDEWRARLGLG